MGLPVSLSFPLSFLFLLPSSLSRLLSCLFQRESREKREEEASGAATLRWLEGGDVGVHACSRARGTQGGRWLAERAREMAGTASRRAYLRRQKKWLWWLLWGGGERENMKNGITSSRRS
uniref:Secreted protein n=1 Tax=Oryza sativa subsp. japonica TaxID=39947 RepID=Q69N71_ORYSJ|nr:hypothetical protein [Oryza sativa Japonica Group]